MLMAVTPGRGDGDGSSVCGTEATLRELLWRPVCERRLLTNTGANRWPRETCSTASGGQSEHEGESRRRAACCPSRSLPFRLHCSESLGLGDPRSAAPAPLAPPARGGDAVGGCWRGGWRGEARWASRSVGGTVWCGIGGEGGIGRTIQSQTPTDQSAVTVRTRGAHVEPHVELTVTVSVWRFVAGDSVRRATGTSGERVLQICRHKNMGVWYSSISFPAHNKPSS